MYPWLLFIHSVLRWVVLLVGFLAFFKALTARGSGRPWAETGAGLARAFAMTMALQLVLGLALLFMSPITQAAFHDMASAMKTAGLRYFAIEHPFGMIIAVALAHIGWIKAKRAADDAAPGIAAKWFGITLLITLLSIPWPFYKAGRALWPTLP